MTKTIVGMFDDRRDAENVVRDLQNSGFHRDDISLVTPNRESTGEQFDVRTGDTEESVAGGAAAGAGTGAVLGGLAGLLVGLGALAIPGIGPLIAAGPLAAALAGAGVGAVTGGLIGALVDAGVPEDEAHVYGEGIRRGSTLVMVRTDDNMADRAASIINRHHPVDVQTRATAWRQEGWQPGTFTETGTGTRTGGMTGTYRSDVTGSGMSSGTTTGSRMGMHDYNTYETDFRSHYDMLYGTRGHDFSYYQPGYRYGFEMGQSDRYRGRHWSEIEPEIRRDWESQHPGNAWDDFKDSIRHAWERVTSIARDDRPESGTGYVRGTDRDTGFGETRDNEFRDRGAY